MARPSQTQGVRQTAPNPSPLVLKLNNRSESNVEPSTAKGEQKVGGGAFFRHRGNKKPRSRFLLMERLPHGIARRSTDCTEARGRPLRGAVPLRLSPERLRYRRGRPDPGRLLPGPGE